MARFRFSLQRVLDYRVQQEEEAKLKFAQARASLEKLKARKAKVEEELESVHNLFKGEKIVECPWVFVECERSLIKEREDLIEEMGQQIDIVERLKGDYLRKRLEREKVERLKEKHRREFYYEESRREQKEADEISTLRFERNFC